MELVSSYVADDARFLRERMPFQVARPFEFFSAFGSGDLVDDMATDVAIDFVVYVVDVLFELARSAK